MTRFTKSPVRGVDAIYKTSFKSVNSTPKFKMLKLSQTYTTSQ